MKVLSWKSGDHNHLMSKKQFEQSEVAMLKRTYSIVSSNKQKHTHGQKCWQGQFLCFTKFAASVVVVLLHIVMSTLLYSDLIHFFNKSQRNGQ